MKTLLFALSRGQGTPLSQRAENLRKSIQIVLPMTMCILIMACNKEEPRGSGSATPVPSTTQTIPAPLPQPTPPLMTSLGTLVRTIRAEQIDVQVLCVNGGIIQASSGTEVYQAAANVCSSKERAGKGKTYIVLQFESQATRKLAKDFGKFVGTSRSGSLARVDGESWLSDVKGKKYKTGFAVVRKSTRQVAFEVPMEATDFVWHDKAQTYPLALDTTGIAEMSIGNIP